MAWFDVIGRDAFGAAIACVSRRPALAAAQRAP